MHILMFSVKPTTFIKEYIFIGVPNGMFTKDFIAVLFNVLKDPQY